MPKYAVELSDGRKFEVEADSQPSEQDVMAALSPKLGKTEPSGLPLFDPSEGLSGQDGAQRPTLGQRAAVSLAREPEAKLAAVNKLGMQGSMQDGQVMANGERIHPGMFEDPLGAAASQIGNAITIGTQVGADLLAAPAAAASGPGAMPIMMGANAAGAAAGDVFRQGFAAQHLGQEFNVGQTMQEGAMGAIAPPVGVAAQKVMAPAWRAMSSGIGKMIKSLGGGAPAALKLMSEVPEEISGHYINRRLKDGVDILDPKNMQRYVDPNKPANMAKKILFGLPEGQAINPLDTENAKAIAKQTEKLGQGALDIYEAYGGIDQMAIQRVRERGAGVVTANPKLQDHYILELAERVQDGVELAYKKAQGEVRETQARLLSGEIIDHAKPIDLVAPNTNLAAVLEREGILTRHQQVVDGKHIMGYKFTPSGNQASDKAERRVFGELINDFFERREITLPPKMKAGETYTAEQVRALANLRSGRIGPEDTELLDRPKQITLFMPKNEPKFGEFIAKLNHWDRRLHAGKQFEELGVMKGALTEYISGDIEKGGLRSIVRRLDPTDMTEQAARSYERMKQAIEPVRQALSSKSPRVIENFFRQLDGPNPTQTGLMQADWLDAELKQVKRGFLDDLRDFFAAKELRKATGENATKMANKLKGDLDKVMSPSSENINLALDMAESKMPRGQQFMQEARDSAVGRAFDRNSNSFIRALWAGRWLTSAMGIGGALGLGPIGMAAGLGMGITLTSPKLGGKAIARGITAPGFQKAYQGAINPTGQLPRAAQAATGPGGRVLLSRLLAGATRQPSDQ